MSFARRVAEASAANRSVLCVGLDVDLARIHRPLLHESDPVTAFATAIVDATADKVCAFKPNLAFFEAYGPQGLTSLARVVDHIHETTRVPVILDAKRGDVGTTAEAYAKGLFDELGADAVTVNPYLGWDGVAPFAARAEKGVLVLVRTSNPSAAEFQDLPVGGEPLYLHVARRVVAWDASGNLGAVAGATAPAELARIREVLGPERLLLVPGVGAQGGSAADAVVAGTNAHGDAAIVTASRSVLYASSGEDFAAAAAREAERLRRELEQARAAKRAGPPAGAPSPAGRRPSPPLGAG